MKKLRVNVEGKSYDVTVELLGEGAAVQLPVGPSAKAPTPVSSAGEGEPVPSPLAGKVVSIAVSNGQRVSEGDELMILEAMKMNTHVYAPQSGTIESIQIQAGDSVEEGQSLVIII
jgi:biotin carboxyl carrier protein